MRRVFLPIILLLSGILQALAQPLGAPAPLPPITAKAWLLYDYQAGREIAAANRDERVEPASLTKLMDAYLVFSAIKQGQVSLQQAVIVSAKAKSTPGSRMYITPEQPVSVDELLHGMIVQSSNDATIALAELLDGTEAAFVQRMNEQAAR